MNALDVSQADFEEKVVSASRKQPVVIDFWAPWCAPCKVLKPILEKLADEYKGKFLLAKVNSDENQEIAARYAVRGIPSVKAMVDGKIVSEFTGALPEGAVRDWLIDRIDAVKPVEQDYTEPGGRVAPRGAATVGGGRPRRCAAEADESFDAGRGQRMGAR